MIFPVYTGDINKGLTGLDFLVQACEDLDPGAVWLPGFACAEAKDLLARLPAMTDCAPFRTMKTPGGHRMSVAMTNCGEWGWITDGKGYRYVSADPLTQRPWPALPGVFLRLAREAAAAGGFPGFMPDSCLINRYVPGAKMSLHQDLDEADLSAPIVSVSLGLPARFLWGGVTRQSPVRRLELNHGDVLVWGGPSRLRFHGVLPVLSGTHPLTGPCRINLTFRQARRAMELQS